MAKFQSILDCFIPIFKLKYEDLENIKNDRVTTLVFNVHQIKCRAFFMGHPVQLSLSGSYYLIIANERLCPSFAMYQIIYDLPLRDNCKLLYS